MTMAIILQPMMKKADLFLQLTNIYQQAMQQFKAILVKKQKQTMHCTLPSDVGFSGPIEDCCYQYYDYWANYLLNFCYLIFHPRPL